VFGLVTNAKENYMFNKFNCFTPHESCIYGFSPSAPVR
jgi:hypothetical protein